MLSKKMVKPTVWGVGVKDVDYEVTRYEYVTVNGKQNRKQVWVCPYYRVWRNMLERCYSKAFHKNNPTYIGCSVSEEWLTFSVFKSWMECQDFEGMQLDKDILFEGNKVYSKGTCVFITKAVNMFTTDRGNARGEWLIGANWNKRYGKFQSRCRNPFTKKHESLGYFTCELEAHQAWLSRKLELAHLLAAEQTDERVGKALIERYTDYL